MSGTRSPIKSPPPNKSWVLQLRIKQQADELLPENIKLSSSSLIKKMITGTG